MKDVYNYPLLDKISESYKSYEGNWSDVYILACQHLLVV